MNDGISTVVSEAIRDTALKLSVAGRKPEEILLLLTDASSKLSAAMEAHPIGCNAAVQQAESTVNNAPLLPPRMMFAGSKESSCHI